MHQQELAYTQGPKSKNPQRVKVVGNSKPKGWLFLCLSLSFLNSQVKSEKKSTLNKECSRGRLKSISFDLIHPGT